MSNLVLSPKSSPNILSITLGYIQQITEKFDRYQEQQLQSLDHAIMNYVQKRNEIKKPILDGLQQETLSIQDLNMANLNVVHMQSECALRKLQQQMSQFGQLKQSIQQSNNRCVRDFVCGEDYNEIGFMLDICKQIVMELSKYRDVEDIVQKVQDYRKRNKNLQRDHDLLAEVQEYIQKIQEVVSDQEEQYGNISQSSRSTMLLQFIQ